MLNSVRIYFSVYVYWSVIGGVIFFRVFFLLSVRGLRIYSCFYGFQGFQVRVFSDPQVEFSGYGGNFYEMFYVDV